jgi:hypothetical protein
MNVNWAQVITHPLGLAGFALALVFSIAGFKVQGRQRAWFLPLAIGLAGLVMIGGFYLAYLQTGVSFTAIGTDRGQAQSGATQSPGAVIQQTQGHGSPTIQGAGGNITITNTLPPSLPSEEKPKVGKK